MKHHITVPTETVRGNVYRHPAQQELQSIRAGQPTSPIVKLQASKILAEYEGFAKSSLEMALKFSPDDPRHQVYSDPVAIDHAFNRSTDRGDGTLAGIFEVQRYFSEVMGYPDPLISRAGEVTNTKEWKFMYPEFSRKLRKPRRRQPDRFR